MTFSSKDQTESTQQLSSGENIEAQVQPSKQSASSDNTGTSTRTTRMQSASTRSADNTGSTTLKISEKSRQHAMIAKVALLQLEKAGLVKRYKVLSKDQTTVKEIRLVFDPDLWSENLELEVLS